jgi:hypothetical protein
VCGLEKSWRCASVLGLAEFREFDLRNGEMCYRLTCVGSDARGLTDERRCEVMMKLTN